MKNFFLIIAGILLINFTSAINICVDHDSPSWVEISFEYSVVNLSSISLDWEPATDIPSCSGIDHYDIYRSYNSQNFIYIASTSETRYADENLPDGNYQYMIHAFDLAGHNEGNGLSSQNVANVGGTSLRGDDGGGGGGSSSSSGEGAISNVESDNIFICDAWEECINGSQIRICKESNGNLPDITEVRSCTPDFISLSSNKIPENNQEQISTTNFFTGAVTGVTDFAKTTGGKVALSFSGLIVISAISIIVVRKYKLKRR